MTPVLDATIPVAERGQCDSKRPEVPVLSQ